MNVYLSHAIAFVLGGGLVGCWWYWIGHKAKVRAVADEAKRAVQGKG